MEAGVPGTVETKFSSFRLSVTRNMVRNICYTSVSKMKQ
jgi:hypothetical protein